MESETYVIMLKNKETGFLETELGSFRPESLGGCIDRVHAEDEDGVRLLHLKLTTASDVSDWEFAAIYDYYDEEALSGITLSVTADPDGYNPAWECVLPFDEDMESMQDKIIAVLKAHLRELEEVMEAIAGREEEYTS